MAYVALDFLPFSDSKMEATRAAWTEDATEGLAFPSEVERLLDWTCTHREHTAMDAAGYGVFHKGKNTAVGICEVIITQKTVRSKWVKMLRLHLKPSVDAELQAGSPDHAMNVFTAAIAGSLDLQLTHKATTLKVYGRTNDQLSFLKVLASHLDDSTKGTLKHTKISIEGRFLCINVT